MSHIVSYFCRLQRTSRTAPSLVRSGSPPQTRTLTGVDVPIVVLSSKPVSKSRNLVRYVARAALLLSAVFLCSLANAQTAFSATSITIAWDEDPSQQSTQLATLNTDIQGALNAAATDFCFAIETAPADLLDFPALNCTIGDAASPNGYTASNASFALILGDMPFDYDSRIAHTLTLTARSTSATPTSRTANSLRVTFTLSNIDETPVLTQEALTYVAPPAHSEETRYLNVGNTFQYNIGSLFRDPEGAPVSLPHSTIEVCDTGVAGDFVENAARCYSYSNLPQTPDVLSVETRGTLLIATADGSGMTSAGVYWAKLYFGASDQTGNVTTKQEGANVTVFVKQGVNNPPQFGGGASGFSVLVDEVAAGIVTAVAINPMPHGAWNATDLDGGANSTHGDTVEYSLVGAQANCLNTGVNAVQIGEMCVAVVTPSTGVALQGYFLDYESPHLSSTKSLSVTLRASDGWNHADVSIEITLVNVNELYAHDDPTTQSVLPMTVRLLQGTSRSFNLDAYFTDPEMDNISYMVFPNALANLVTHSGSSLTLTGVGTSPANPTVQDVVTVRADDGLIQLERTIQVEVRNTNTPPRFEPAGVTGVGGGINENVPIGTAVSHLVQYADDDSTADEITVSLSSNDFSAIVDPIWDGANVCLEETATCVRQTNQIAIVTAASINYEQTSSYVIDLGLHDGWVASDSNRAFTYTVTVNNVNDPPIAVGEVPDRSIRERGVATFSVGEYFSDEDMGDRLIISAVSSNRSVATATVRGVDELTITGVAIGTSTITLTGSDNAGLTATQTFQVNVQTNQPPVANVEAFTSALPANLEMLVGQNHEAPLRALFTDPEGDTITVAVASSATNVVLATPTGTGENAVAVLLARALGSAEITFTAVDTAGNETAETRTIEVVSELSSENQPPEVNQSALKAVLPARNELVLHVHLELTLTDIFTDPDGDDMTFVVESSDIGVVLPNLATDNVSLFLFPEAVGTATITITATDSAGNVNSLDIELTVVEEGATENRAPTLNQTAFDTALPTDNTMQQRNYHETDMSGLFTDPDGDELSFQVASSNTTVLRTSRIPGGSSAFLIARAIGSSDLSITATDTAGNTATGTARIRVVANDSEGENEPPVLDREALNAALPANNTLPVPEFFELQLDTLFTDPNPNDRVEGYDVSSSDESVLLVVLDPGNILTAFARSAGTAMMTIVARDTLGAETPVTETITVTEATSNALVFGVQTLDRGAPLTLDINDVLPNAELRNTTFNLHPVVRDSSILASHVDGSRITLTALAKGETLVKLTVTNDAGFEAKTMFFVNVVNAAPTLVSSLPDQTTTRVSELNLDLRDAFQDADGESLQVTARVLDESVVDMAFEDGMLAIKGLEVGETVVTLTAVDTNGASTEATFNVTVENLGPSVNASVGGIHLQLGGEPYRLTFADWFTDEDDELTYSATLASTRVVSESTTPTGVTYTPLARGNVILTITASDPHGGVASLTTEIVVGNERLNEVAIKSLAGFGRAMLGSVSSALDTRANLTRSNSDLSENSLRPDTLNAWVASESTNPASSHPGGGAYADEKISLPSLTRGRSYGGFDQVTSSSVSPFHNGFSIKLGSNDEAKPWSIWSNMDRQSYSGGNYGGSVNTAYLGIDKEVGEAWVLGLTASRHQGDSDYAYGTATQQLGIKLNQLMPYFRYAPNNRASLWGTIGIGEGELTTSVVGADAASSRLTSRLAIVGGRQRVTNSSQLEIALRGDLAASNLVTSSGETASSGFDVNVHRLRTGVETSYTLNWLGDMSLTPFGRLNLRVDGGDGDTGTGLEFAGGLKIGHGAFAFEMMGNSFNVEGQQPYSESGVTMSAMINPSQNGTGLLASISPRWGTNTNASDVIWGGFNSAGLGIQRTRPSGMEASERHIQLDSEIGYGFLIVDERFLLTPFVQHAKYGSTRQQTLLGAQLRQSIHSKGSISSRIALGRVNRSRHQRESTLQVLVQMSF